LTVVQTLGTGVAQTGDTVAVGLLRRACSGALISIAFISGLALTSVRSRSIVILATCIAMTVSQNVAALTFLSAGASVAAETGIAAALVGSLSVVTLCVWIARS
jgi:hypothetical protein